MSSLKEEVTAISTTGIAHLLREHLAHLDHKDHPDLLVIEEKLEIQETQAHLVQMVDRVHLVQEENLVKVEKEEIVSTRNAQ